MKVIDHVANNTVLNLEGPVTIKGDVSDNAKINVTNGALKIEGKLGNKVSINCTKSDDSDISASACSVNIVGASGDNLTVTCDGDFIAKGNIGDVLTVTTHNGNVILPNEIGAYAQIKVETGNLTVFNYGQKSNFTALQGSLSMNGQKKNRSNILADIPTDRLNGSNNIKSVVIQNGRVAVNSSSNTASTHSNDSDDDSSYRNMNTNGNNSGFSITTTFTQGGTTTRTVYQGAGTTRMCITVAGTITNTHNSQAQRNADAVVNTNTNNDVKAKPRNQ